jgi:CheY-like chemotaxis protein
MLHLHVQTSQRPAHETRARVLLVDDDEDVLEALTLLLNDDYTVACAHNGAEACATLDEGRAHPSVILLDMMMPIMGGLDFLRWKAASRHAPIPVIIFTASVSSVAAPFANLQSVSKTANIADIVAAMEHAMHSD